MSGCIPTARAKDLSYLAIRSWKVFVITLLSFLFRRLFSPIPSIWISAWYEALFSVSRLEPCFSLPSHDGPCHGAWQTHTGSWLLSSHLPPLWHIKCEQRSYAAMWMKQENVIEPPNGHRVITVTFFLGHFFVPLGRTPTHSLIWNSVSPATSFIRPDVYI